MVIFGTLCRNGSFDNVLLFWLFLLFLSGHPAKSYHGLCVAILPAHGEIQAKRVAVDNINVASLRPA